MEIFTRERALAIAEQVIDQSDQQSFAEAFDVRGLVVAGLAQHIMAEPIDTLAKLAAVKEKEPAAGEQAKAGAEPGEPGLSEPAKKRARRGGGKRKRSARTTPEQLEELKAKVRQLLKKQPSTTRKDICEAAGITRLSLYNRLIKSMANELKAKGQKSKRIYVLK